MKRTFESRALPDSRPRDPHVNEWNDRSEAK